MRIKCKGLNKLTMLSILMCSTFIMFSCATSNSQSANINNSSYLNNSTLEATSEKYFEFSKLNNQKGYSIKLKEMPEDTTEIIIPNMYNNLPVIRIEDSAFEFCELLTSIIIPNSITSIGNDAFVGCFNLTSIMIPISVTDISTGAFFGCSSLTFYCEVDSQPSGWEPMWNTSDRQVYWGVSAKDIYIQDGIKYIIQGEEAKVTEYTSSLPSAATILSNIIMDGKVYNVTSIENYAFYTCSSLTTISIPSSVRSIGNFAFYECSFLNSIIIPNSVKSIGKWAFSHCRALTLIVIPSSVISIEEHAFNCKSLTIYCEASSKPSGWSSKWNTSDRQAYWGVSAKDIYIQDGIQYIIQNEEAIVTGYTSDLPSNITIQKSITFNKKVYNVTSVGEWAFCGCTFMISITIPNSVTSIREHAFYGCGSLTSILIPNSITSIGGWAFYECASMTSIVIPSSVTSVGEQAFYSQFLTIYCEASEKPNGWHYNWNESRPVYWGINEDNCIFQDGIIYVIKDERAIVTGYTVDLSPNVVILDTLKINEQTYNVTSIEDNVFYNCTKLQTVTFENESKLESIGKKAFYYCRALTSIKIPNSVTNIGDSAFEGCNSLASIVIPNSVVNIGEYAFFGCGFLTIYCEASSQPSGWNSRWKLNELVYWASEWSYVDGVPTPNN